MLARLVLKRRARQDGESPFWISYSDLMSALMILFLVVMAVTLIAVTKSVTAEEEQKIQREKDIRELMSQVKENSREFPEVKVNESTFRIDLGEVVRFESGRYDITASGAKFLRRYIPALLKAQATDIGKKRVRRVVVEGFTDQDGTYLYNLELSLNRSRSVVCVLFAKPGLDETPLTDAPKGTDQRLVPRGRLLVQFNSRYEGKEPACRTESGILGKR